MDDKTRLVVEQLLKGTKQIFDNERRMQTEKRLDIYQDYYKEILKAEIDNQFATETRKNVKQMIDDSANIVKRIINEISQVYNNDASRKYVLNEEENEVYSDLLKNIPTDLIMQEVNRLTNLCNECLVYIVPRNGRIEYDIITPDQIEVFQNESDPTRADAILFTRSFVDSLDNTRVIKVYWDVYGNHRQYDEHDQELHNFGNPYYDPDNLKRTILPFVIFHKNYPKDAIFDRTSGQDLISATIQIGVLSTYLNYLIKVNSFKQLWMTGVGESELPASLILDPLYPLTLKNTGAQIGTVDYQVLFDKIWQIITEKISVIANNYGLSMDNFKLTASAQSGYALELKNQGLEKVIGEQLKHYRYYENELFDKTKIINNTMMDAKIPDDGAFKIDFAEIDYPESPKDEREQWSFDIKMGARSVYDYVRSVNPDAKTDDEADALIKKNIEANQKVQADYGIDIMTLVNEALNPTPAGGEQTGEPGEQITPEQLL